MSKLVSAIDYGPIMTQSNNEHAAVVEFRRRNPEYDKLPDDALIQWGLGRRDVPTEDEADAQELTAFDNQGAAHRGPTTMSDDA